MSNQLSIAGRRSLQARPAETVERLFGAAVEELDAVGHEALTIRAVAQRAGVSPATAYTYLASKDRLFAQLFWRLLAADQGPGPLTGPPAARLSQTIRHLGALISGAPLITAAATKSLLGSDPHVALLRPKIGALFIDRFREAIGPHTDPRILQTISLAFFGALLNAGMGLCSYAELGDRLDDVVAVIMEGAG